jgi:hypothetical protein
MTVEDLSNRSIEGGRSPSPCHHDSAPQSVIFNCGASFSCIGNPKTRANVSTGGVRDVWIDLLND